MREACATQRSFQGIEAKVKFLVVRLRGAIRETNSRAASGA